MNTVQKLLKEKINVMKDIENMRITELYLKIVCWLFQCT